MIDDRSRAPRLALHAAELGFIHPVTGEDLFFRAPFPEDLSEFYNRLSAGLRRRIN
jgi:23S rRNA pseudouridine1911/1915/1917 synthase